VSRETGGGGKREEGGIYDSLLCHHRYSVFVPYIHVIYIHAYYSVMRQVYDATHS